MSTIPATGDVAVAYRPPDFTPVATLNRRHAITYRIEKNGPGAGQVAIPLDDPAHAVVQVNDVIALRRGGKTAAAVLVERIAETTIHEQGGARQVAVYYGRLVGAFLEWALIFPALGDRAKPIEDDCVLDWRSPRYAYIAYGDPWVDSTELVSVTAAKAGDWPTQPMGQDFTDSTGAMMLWASGGTTEFADPGICLFLLDVDIEVGGRHGLEVLTDNDGYVWVDGTQQLQINETEGYHRASFKRLDLTPGLHRFAFQVRNIGPAEIAGPAALAFNLFKTDHQDRPMPDVPVVAKSTSAVKVLEYPDGTPGMTVGDGLRQFLNEANARGKLTWVVPTFTLYDDSNGDPWPREHITTKTGTTTLLQYMDELVAAGRISRWRFRPDGVTLDVFAPGYSTRPTFAGYPTGLMLEPAPALDARSGQVVELNRTIT